MFSPYAVSQRPADKQRSLPRRADTQAERPMWHRGLQLQLQSLGGKDVWPQGHPGPEKARETLSARALSVLGIATRESTVPSTRTGSPAAVAATWTSFNTFLEPHHSLFPLGDVDQVL